jgi:type IV pilus assembly protein PilX
MPVPKKLSHIARFGSRHQGGVVLIAALAVLLMLTLLSVGMFRSFGLEERITGNSREKQHAFYAAQSSLHFAEAWLTANATAVAATCNGTMPTTTICANSPSAFSFATSDWHTSYGSTYAPAQISTSTSAQNSTGNIQPAYAAPQYYITFLGPDPASPSSANLYQVTAIGFGGNASATAVVQSVYSVGSSSSCASYPCD